VLSLMCTDLISDIEPGHFVCAAELVEAEIDNYEVNDQTHGPPLPTNVAAHQSASSLPTQKVDPPFPADSEESATTQSSLDSSLPRRSSSWAADGIPGVSSGGQSRYAGTEFDKKKEQPASASSSATATPQSATASNINFPSPVIPAGLAIKAHVPSLRTGQQRTATNRSSGSSGDGDGVTAKPASKRSKSAASRNLYGSLHVPAARVIAPEGELGLWFLFTVSCRVDVQSLRKLIFRI
jgi:hypothetical protein